MQQHQLNEIRYQHTDLRTELSRILETALTQAPGLQTPTIPTLLTELGRELSAFPVAKHLAAWLGLCPDNRISGRRVLSATTRKATSRAATALRLTAQSLHHSLSALGEFYHRLLAIVRQRVYAV